MEQKNEMDSLEVNLQIKVEKDGLECWEVKQVDQMEKGQDLQKQENQKVQLMWENQKGRQVVEQQKGKGETKEHLCEEKENEEVK